MYYRAKLMYRTIESLSEGSTDDVAIRNAVADSISIQGAIKDGDQAKIAVVVFQVTGNDQHVSYVTTYSQYLRDIA